MFTFPLLAFALSLLTPTSATPSPSLTPRAPQKLDGSCPTLHLPLESEFTSAYTLFCANLQRDDTVIRKDYPLKFTYQLRAGDGSIMPWVLVNEVYGYTTNGEVKTTNTSECMQRFGSMLDDGLGGLGKGYCVVDGTGGDAFEGVERKGEDRGEGVVLVKEGKIKTNAISGQFSMWAWESRPKRGGLSA